MGMSVFQEVGECFEFLKLVFAEVWDSIMTILCPFNLKATKPEYTDYISDFSVSEYMDRLEKAGIEIMDEAEKRPEYKVILWAGLDGLRMNQDGTTEWIRREEKKQEPVSVFYSPPNQLLSVSSETMQNPFSGFQNITEQIDSQIRNQTCQIENSIRMMQMQMEQNMVNCIRPAYGPPYIQAMNPYWPSPYSQCAVHQGWMKPQ